MKLRSLTSCLFIVSVLALSSGCAVLTTGRTQSVVVKSNPEGATALINGEEVGKTPFRVTLKRASAYTIELRKSGFENTPIVVLPVDNGYSKRILRWGIDYDLGATTELVPNQIEANLNPAVNSISAADRFEEMSYRVLQADAMLLAKQISVSDHKYIVGEIVKFYSN